MRLYLFLSLPLLGGVRRSMGSYEEVQDAATVNSEIRFITLELMKISVRTRRPFDKVLEEFRRDAFKVKRFLSHPHPASAKKRR